MGVKNIIGELQVNGSKVITEDTLPESGTFSGSYNDLTNKPDIPSSLSELSDDATHRTVTDAEKAAWNAKSNFSGSYNDLTNKPDIPSIAGLATETYVNNKVASIVDSSPETLDTLNELAAALGDDPNFATTVATEIGKKVDKVTGKGLSTNDFTDDYKNTIDALVGSYSEGLKYTLKYNGEYEVAGIGTCADTDIVIPSVINGHCVTSIGDSAFENCSTLASITIPDSVTSIGVKAFYVCKALTSVAIPDSVTAIGSHAFASCSSLTGVTIPNGVTTIGDYTLHYCSALTSITIPDSVTNIGEWAFDYCSNLTSITIPNSVTSIGNYALYGCNNVTIYCEVESQPSGWDSDWNRNNRPVVWGAALDIPSTNNKITKLEEALGSYVTDIYTLLGGK